VDGVQRVMPHRWTGDVGKVLNLGRVNPSIVKPPAEAVCQIIVVREEDRLVVVVHVRFGGRNAQAV
jgi:hypothetical protein